MKSTASLLIAATLALPALVSLAQQPAAPAISTPVPAAVPATGAKPDVAQGGTKFAAICAACHAPDANSMIPANPKLAQQHPEYLIKQLQEFKSGKRASPIMQGFAAQLTDADMRNVSYWAASQKAKPGFAKDKELVTLGERIYRGGLADRQIVACAGCHSPNGAGVPSQYPRLSGQHADYVAAQLVNFREGVRRNSPQMAQIAARLSDREVRAVADYIAGLR